MAEKISSRLNAMASFRRDASQLRKLFTSVRTELVALRALTAELAADHAVTITVLDDLKAKYEDHRHSVAGAAAVGTKPSTAGAAAAATASTVTQSLATLTATAVSESLSA
jgi:phage I-like protein